MSILLFAPAITIVQLISETIRARRISAIYDVAIALVAVAIACAVFQMLQGASLLHMEGRAVSRVTATI